MELLGLWQSGMVLQRGCENTYFGSGASEATVSFCGRCYTAVKTKNGFCVTIPSHDAGGPYDMLVKADAQEITLTDIYVGDLWLLGGQSNMELPIRRTLDVTSGELQEQRSSEIRAFLYTQTMLSAENERVYPKGEWISANTNRILDFSAIGYYFAKNIHDNKNVAVGLIQTAQGGTRIESWMSVQTLKSFDEAFEEYRASTNEDKINAIHQENTKEIKAWQDSINADDAGLQSNWHICPPTMLNTAEMPQVFENSLGQGFCGSVWLYKEIELQETPQATALLRLGAIVDADKTYINGVLVGETGYRYPPRKYTIEQGVLKQGVNLLAVRVIVAAGRGGFVLDKKYTLEYENNSIDLSGTWRYAIGAKSAQCPEQIFKQGYPTWLYNGMIYPLRHTKIKGIAFYQGESNTEKPSGYCDKLLATVKCWRELFENEKLPFLYVQLANYDDPVVTGGFAKIREQQLRAAKLLQNGGMAIAMDLGENNDLHPQNKPAVAKRLYELSRKYAYGEQCEPDAPYPKHVIMREGEVEITLLNAKLLTNPEGTTINIKDINGKATQHVAKISGNSIILSGVSPKAISAEYQNEDTPQTSFIYNEHGLPCSAFVCNINSVE